MGKNIKRKMPAVPDFPLPFKPTSNPTDVQVKVATEAVLRMAQGLFDNANPAATLSTLTAAVIVYAKNAENAGMPKEEIDKFNTIGAQLASIVLNELEETRKKAESGIITAPSGLVDANGNPILSSEPILNTEHVHGPGCSHDHESSHDENQANAEEDKS